MENNTNPTMANAAEAPVTNLSATEANQNVETVQVDTKQTAESPEVAQPVAETTEVKAEPVAEPVAETTEVKAEPVAEAPKKPAKPDPLADVKSAQADKTVLQGKVIELVPTGDGKHGARVKLDAFPNLPRQPFLPKSHFGFGKPVSVGDTVKVCVIEIKLEKGKKPDIVVSRKVGQEQQKPVQAKYIGSLKPGDVVTVAGRRPNSKGGEFVEIGEGFEALLPEREQCAEATGMRVAAVDPAKMSVILSEKMDYALTSLTGQQVKAEVTGTAVRKRDDRAVGRECKLVDTGIRAFMPGDVNRLPDVGNFVTVEVEKTEIENDRLKVVIYPVDEQEAQTDEQVSEQTGQQPAAPAVEQPAEQAVEEVTEQEPVQAETSDSDDDDDRGHKHDRRQDHRRGGVRNDRGSRHDKGGSRRRDDDDHEGGNRGRHQSRREEKRISWSERLGLIQGRVVNGKLVSFEDRGFTVKLTGNGNAEAYLDKSEVTDEDVTDEWLQKLVGTSEQLFVLAVDDERQQVSVSLKRAFPASLKWGQPITGYCKEVVKNGDRIITIAGQKPYKADGKIPMDHRNVDKLKAINAGDQVTVILNSVPGAATLIFKLPEA